MTAPHSATEGAAMAYVWRKVADAFPRYDEHMRVLVYTQGVEFAGEQFFDIRAMDFYRDGPDDEEGTEITRAATHWMPLPFPLSPIAPPTAEEPKACAHEWEHRCSRDGAGDVTDSWHHCAICGAEE